MNSDLWKAMNAVNQVALIFHETIYRWLRLAGEEDSRDARKIVGYLFSTTPLVPVTNGIEYRTIQYSNPSEHSWGSTTLPKDAVNCQTASGTQLMLFDRDVPTLDYHGNVYLSPLHDTETVLQFTQIDMVPITAVRLNSVFDVN